MQKRFKKNNQPIINVIRDKNEIAIFRLNHPKVVSDIIQAFRYGLKEEYNTFILDLSAVDLVFPNVCVPLAGIVDYYQNQGIQIEFNDIPQYLQNIKVLNPLNVIENSSQLRRGSLDTVWRFNNSEDINTLVDRYIEAISHSVVCEPGVLEGLTWCLNEVMDNVIQHSKKSYGYVMGQIHKTTNHIAFCIFDNGQGIFNSLKDTIHAPRWPVDAITLAIKEGVTRDKTIGQGNGLWGLHGIIKNNLGRLCIASSSGSYLMLGDKVKIYDKIPCLSKESGTSTIDFQIDCNKSISLSEALGGYEPVSIRLENFEDDIGNIHYKLSEKSSGTGTRKSGEMIRTEIINVYKETNKVLIIDFDDIAVISSSFADELVGKLVIYFGFCGFNQIVRLKNMNATVQAIIQRSVTQRMSESYN